MNYFLVTIKSRGDPYTSKEELDKHYKKCINQFTAGDWSSFMCYEYPSTKRMHIHTIVCIPKRIRWTGLLKKVNCSRMYTHLKQFPYNDYFNIISYIRKQAYNIYEQEQLIQQNYYAHIYAF